MPRSRSRRGTRRLFDRWAQVAERLRAAKHLALFLDFDGTLVPLRPRPEDVWLDDAARQVLRRLACHPRLTVCIVSGRRLKDVRRRARVRGARYLGLHGWERDDSPSCATGAQELLRCAKRLLAQCLAGLEGLRVEDKGFTFAVHYRGAPLGTARRARAIVHEALKPFTPPLRVLEGKKVWEVLPSDVEGKGAAVRKLLGELPGAALPVYLGDDATDESAFAALRHGVTVRVGNPRRTKARFCLRDPKEVITFLQKLEAEIA